MSESVKNYKKEAISIARDFHYSTSILARLNNATTESEICRLMIQNGIIKNTYIIRKLFIPSTVRRWIF